MATRKPVIKLTKHPYTEVEELVTAGVSWGWNRAHKHTDTPSPEAIQASIVQYVMTTLAEDAEFVWSRHAGRRDSQD